MFYVYAYLTESGLPYYIGKGKGRRIDVRHSHVERPAKDRRIIIKDGLSNEEAKNLEKELITKYGRKIDGGILDNIKINQWACHTGWKHSDEAIRKIREGNLGKVRTAQQIENYKGKKTEQHSANIKNAVKALWADPVYKAQRLEQVRQKMAARKQFNV